MTSRTAMMLNKEEKQEVEEKVVTKPESELRRSSSFGIEMVDLYVGPEMNRKHFRVHKAVLCRKVKVFDRMFNSEFSEASESKATFSDDDPASFGILTEWVYTNKIINPKLGEDWKVASTFAIAEKYQMPDLMEAIMDCMLRWHAEKNNMPGFALARGAYELTPEGSPLRKLGAWNVAIVLGRPKGWKFKQEDLVKLLQKVEGLLEDALDFVKEFNGAVSRPSQVVDGALKLPFKEEISTPNTG